MRNECLVLGKGFQSCVVLAIPDRMTFVCLYMPWIRTKSKVSHTPSRLCCSKLLVLQNV